MGNITDSLSTFPTDLDTFTTLPTKATAFKEQYNGLGSAVVNIETVLGIRKTQGSILFAGLNGNYTQDNANFFWDDTNNRLGIGTASPANKLHVVGDAQITTDLTVGDQLIVSGTGPHAIGGGTVAGISLRLPGGMDATGQTNGATFKIDAPTTGATNNYSLWVVGGISAIRLEVGARVGLVPSGGPRIDFESADLNFVGGTMSTKWFNNLTSAERMRLTDAGILALGTTVVTGAVTGDLVLANTKALCGVNAGGTAAERMVESLTGRTLISGSGNDIQWGNPLVALGGGAAPTLGTIGGSGPATAAQNTWLRVVDSTGAAAWLPIWK